MASFTLTDNAGSPSVGCVATIAGSSGGANVLYAARVDDSTGLGSFAVGGTLTGDGDVSLTLAKGYWFVSLTTDGIPQEIARVGVTDGLDAVATRCRNAIRDTLLLLTSTYGLGPGKVVAGQWDDTGPDVDRTNLPSLPVTVLTVARLQDTVEYYTNGLDGHGHPTALFLLGQSDPKDPANLANYEAWRQGVGRAFHNQRLAGVIESRYNVVEPLRIAESGADLTRLEGMVSSLVVRAFTREIRGLGA